MNIKGFSFILTFMLVVTLFFLGLALAKPLTEVTDEQRAALDCTNSSISTLEKATCAQVDLYAPFFVGALFGFAGILIGRSI